MNELTNKSYFRLKVNLTIRTSPNRTSPNRKDESSIIYFTDEFIYVRDENSLLIEKPIKRITAIKDLDKIEEKFPNGAIKIKDINILYLNAKLGREN